ncbi:MAG: type III-B CRISPR module RAMP protein Cmr1 [Candidatus Bathyarchaeia archaeon]
MENRKECRVEVLTVTPVFLAGANPRTSVELRSPSFRGALRFWFRALLGGVLGDNPEEIFKREKEVFGSTDYGSPVIVRVRGELGTTDYNPLPHKDDKDVRFKFKGLEPNKAFSIVLVSRNEGVINEVAKALRLLCLLGGIGKRSRRGFGSLQIANGDLPKLEAATTKELSSHLKEQLNKMTSNKFAVLNSTPGFAILHPLWAQVRVCVKEFDYWEEAIRFVMKKAHEHKNPALGWAGREGRQASPVHVHVTRLANGRYSLVLTTLLSRLNPSLKMQADREELVRFLENFEGFIVFGFEEVPKNWPIGNEK